MCPSPSLMPTLDRPLGALGFEYDHISPEKVTGRLRVTEKCCQPFKVLHGGVSALVAESLASMGAYVVSGFGRVAGLQLSINHHKPALLGDVVVAEAVPVHFDNTIQVWEVQLWKTDPSNHPDERTLVSSSKVTLATYRRPPENGKGYEEMVRKYAKL